MAKGGSKFLTGLISFILGFLFAILVEIGAIFGVYWFVMNKDINTVMAAIGIPNTDDRYINTDKDNGGVTTLKELLSGVKGLVYENGEFSLLGKSFDDINGLIPATQLLLDKFYGIADDYIELDKEAFQGKPMTELAVVLSDSIMNIKTAALLEKLNMDTVIGDEANPLVKSLVAGSECEYATVTYADGRESTLRLPVMYDYYMLQEGTYSRICDNSTAAIPQNIRDNQDRFLTPAGTVIDKNSETQEEQTFERYAIYYVPCKVTASGVEEAEYLTEEVSVEDGGKTYRFQVLKYGEGTDFITVEYNGGDFKIDYDAVYASLNGESASVSDRFEGYSYYEPYAANYYYTTKSGERYELKTWSGKNYFRDNENKLVQLDALTLYDIVVDPFAPLDSVLVTEVAKSDNEADNKSIEKIFGTTTLGTLLRGEGVNDIINNLEVSDVVEKISPENKVLCYISYKISHLQAVGDGTYKAVYDKDGADERDVIVYLDVDGYVVEVKDENGVAVDGVKVRDVTALTNSMPITMLMDVRVDEPIMVYLGYGVKSIKSEAGEGYSHTGKISVGGEDKTCYLATETVDGVEQVISVWYEDENGNKVNIGGTKVNAVSERINSFTDDMTVGDVLGLDGSESQLLKAIKDTPLSGMGDRIDSLTVGEIMSAEEIEKSSMLRQLRNKKITELSTAIDELLIQRVYAKEVYNVPENSDPALATEFHEEWLYYVKEGDTFVLDHAMADAFAEGSTERDDAMGHITQAQFDGGEYYTYGEAQGMWRIVLYKEGREKAYTMNNFNNMVAACADTVYKSTLYELQSAGILQIEIPDDGSNPLDKTFENIKPLGQFTLEELMIVVIAMSK